MQRQRKRTKELQLVEEPPRVWLYLQEAPSLTLCYYISGKMTRFHEPGRSALPLGRMEGSCSLCCCGQGKQRPPFMLTLRVRDTFFPSFDTNTSDIGGWGIESSNSGASVNTLNHLSYKPLARHKLFELEMDLGIRAGREWAAICNVCLWDGYFGGMFESFLFSSAQNFILGVWILFSKVEIFVIAVLWQLGEFEILTWQLVNAGMWESVEKSLSIPSRVICKSRKAGSGRRAKSQTQMSLKSRFGFFYVFSIGAI